MLRMFNLILGILMVLPALGWLIFQGWVAWQATEVMRILGDWPQIIKADAQRRNPMPQVEVTLGAQGTAPAAPGATAIPAAGQQVKLNVLNAAGDRRMRDRIDQHLNPAARGNARDMRVNLMVDIRTLLAPGEALPPEALRKVFIDARAARLAEAECADIRAVHGNCTVFDISVGGSRSNATLFATLAWLEAAPVPAAP